MFRKLQRAVDIYVSKKKEEVIIGDNVWIGKNVTILGGLQ